MTKLRYSSQAIRDVERILKSVERDRPGAAIKLGERFFATCEQLADNPTMGTARNDLRSGLRVFSVSPYVIFFRSSSGVVQIHRIVHGARDYATLFRRRKGS